MSFSYGTTENQVRRNKVVQTIRKEDQLVVVVGTGVSAASIDSGLGISTVAGWQGLLRNGLQRCTDHGLIEEKAAFVVEAEINEGSVEFLICAAQKITDRLNRGVNGLRFWLKESVGQLQVSDSCLIEAIAGLGGILATLNYDDLLHQVTQRPPLHWLEGSRLNRLLREGSKDFILHLHGHWEDPESIILDRRSYEKISKDVKTHDLLREFTRSRTLLFIGCGETFLDPNLQTWLEWAKVGMDGEAHRHFILCRDEDQKNFHQQLREHGYIAPLVYGNNYSELRPFLLDLAREGGVTAVGSNSLTADLAPTTIQSTFRLSQPLDIWNREAKR